MYKNEDLYEEYQNKFEKMNLQEKLDLFEKVFETKKGKCPLCKGDVSMFSKRDDNSYRNLGKLYYLLCQDCNVIKTDEYWEKDLHFLYVDWTNR